MGALSLTCLSRTQPILPTSLSLNVSLPKSSDMLKSRSLEEVDLTSNDRIPTRQHHVAFCISFAGHSRRRLLSRSSSCHISMANPSARSMHQLSSIRLLPNKGKAGLCAKCSRTPGCWRSEIRRTTVQGDHHTRRENHPAGILHVLGGKAS